MPFGGGVLHYLPIWVNPSAMATIWSCKPALMTAGAAAIILAGLFKNEPLNAASVIADNWVTRPNTAVRVLLMKADHPTYAVMLLPGGHGNINLDSQGHIGWGEDDFAIRTRWHYFDHGIAAIVPDVALDHKPPVSLAGFRTSELQAEDLRALSEQLHGMASKVWIIAYDTGATSALNAIARGKIDSIAGLVLISPILEQPDPDSTLLIDGVKRALGRMPVLVISHQLDPCSSPVANQIRNVATALRAPHFQSIILRGGQKQFMLHDAFAYPEGSCNTQPAHALAGLEEVVTSKIIDWLSNEGSIVLDARSDPPAATDIANLELPPVSQLTALSALPEPATPGFRWEVVRGLNVRAVNADAMVSGQAVLRLTAIANDNGHTLAVRVTGLNKNQTYRIAAWVKSVAGGNVELAALDHPDADKPVNNGDAIFDLNNHQVFESFGVQNRDIEQHSGSWQKVWINLATSDGQFEVAIRPAMGRKFLFIGDGKLGLILGGLEVEPLE
jgi:pimeloyl-ACP methyl ester carboxylesterase